LAQKKKLERKHHLEDLGINGRSILYKNIYIFLECALQFIEKLDRLTFGCKEKLGNGDRQIRYED
jgi:hypothetical protein